MCIFILYRSLTYWLISLIALLLVVFKPNLQIKSVMQEDACNVHSNYRCFHSYYMVSVKTSTTELCKIATVTLCVTFVFSWVYYPVKLPVAFILIFQLGTRGNCWHAGGHFTGLFLPDLYWTRRASYWWGGHLPFETALTGCNVPLSHVIIS